MKSNTYDVLSTKLIASDKSFVIDACDGTQTFANAYDVFIGIDDGLLRKSFNIPSPPTLITDAKVYEGNDGKYFFRITHICAKSFDKLELTQSQIVAFCKKYKQLFKDVNIRTFFFFAVGDFSRIAEVFAHTDGLYVYLASADCPVEGKERYRIIVPI